MTVNEAYQLLKEQLQRLYKQREAANIADMVVEHVCGFGKTQRLVHKNDQLQEGEPSLIFDYLNQLKTYKPVQYVLNETWFYGMKFFVDENVLIPRPETEELVNWIVEDCIQSEKNKKILDIGTGSGCIAVALKKQLNDAVISGCDINKEIIMVATKNAAINTADVHFFVQDISKQIKNDDLKFDILVSNPPYIPKNELNGLDKNLSFEPAAALFVPNENPLLFYEYIADFALEHLDKNGSLYFEIHENFASQVVLLLSEKGFAFTEVRKDLQLKNRMIKAKFEN